MEWTRRTFVKIAGISLLGWGARPAFAALTGKERGKVLWNPKALKAKRWAMVVDLRKKCPEGCRDCIDACHGVHNVPDFGNPKDEIKWIWNEPYGNAFPGQENGYIGKGIGERPVIVLCNHCDNPPCVRVCPTQATFRRADGIVMMDYHRCIGCRFCVAACPFGARSMNYRDPRPFIKKINPDYPTRTNGVVEKCDFCAERLAEGLPPACVNACKERLFFGPLENPESEVRKLLEANFTIRRKPHLGTQPQVYYIV
ncbi:MAG: sulfate reduction electron transfer complex DsrMKJOP subunit DsrO [Planctomycetaceae bacterium]